MIALALGIGGAAPAAGTASSVAPPRAERIVHETVVHGQTLRDEYFWLRRRDDPTLGPRVLEHLRAERAYADAAMAHTAARQETLYQEMLGRVQQTDSTAPVRHGAYLYYTRFEEGKALPIYARKPYPDGPEQILIDANKAGEGRRNFRVRGVEPSPDHEFLAIVTDVGGEEKFTITFRDLRTDADLPAKIEGVAGAVAWGGDSRSVFYTTLDETMRPAGVRRHALGTETSKDELVYHEPDEAFYVNVELTRSERYVLISSASKETTEWRYIPARSPQQRPVVIAPRRRGHQYFVEHHEGRFLIRTNDTGESPNFRLVEAPIEMPGEELWRELLPHRSDTLMTDVLAFREHLVVAVRRGGLPGLVIRPFRGSERIVETDEASFVLEPEENPEYDTRTLRYEYSSPVTPRSVYEIHMDSGERTLLKRANVPTYDASKYAVELVQVPAADGERVPLTLVYRKDLVRDGSAPALLEGYAAYGISAQPSFNSRTVSLLDRGFVLAEAHARGGSDKGRAWYDAGRLAKKKNSFTDFIACAQWLIDNKYTSPARLGIIGGSAGGLLVGAATTMRPELFGAVVAQVPFVDVINTMLDESIPLTVTEFDEWGNPGADPEAFRTILAYSPYDNTRPARYPHILLTAGLNDPRVPYWEPAKWAQRLRDNNTGDSLVLLRIDLDAGHGGFSDRYQALRDAAFVQAFLLDRLGVPEPRDRAPAGRRR